MKRVDRIFFDNRNAVLEWFSPWLIRIFYCSLESFFPVQYINICIFSFLSLYHSLSRTFSYFLLWCTHMRFFSLSRSSIHFVVIFKCPVYSRKSIIYFEFIGNFEQFEHLATTSLDKIACKKKILSNQIRFILRKCILISKKCSSLSLPIAYNQLAIAFIYRY